jgi:hypothetical protein
MAIATLAVACAAIIIQIVFLGASSVFNLEVTLVTGISSVVLSAVGNYLISRYHRECASSGDATETRTTVNPAAGLEWIQEIDRLDREDATRRELNRLAHVQATSVVKQDGPQFFHDLLAALELNAEGIKILGLLGRVEMISEDQTECQWRITVERRSAIPKSTWVNLFYAPGDESIRLHTRDLNTIFGKPTELTLCDVGGRAACVSDGLPAGSTAHDAAKLIVSRMVTAIRS